jgi:predicted transcriptional regulator
MAAPVESAEVTDIRLEYQRKESAAIHSVCSFRHMIKKAMEERNMTAQQLSLKAGLPIVFVNDFLRSSNYKFNSPPLKNVSRMIDALDYDVVIFVKDRRKKQICVD